MYNRTKKSKHSNKNVKHPQEKNKTIRHSAVKTPKQLEITKEPRSPQLSKFKSLPSKAKREMTTSLLPPDLNFLDNQNEPLYTVYRTNNTNVTAVDIPYTRSEKTINFQSTDKLHGSIYRLEKKEKKSNPKTDKFDLEFKTKTNEILTTRKSSAKKLTLDTLLRKTDRLLKKYQKREQEWRKERATLMDEIEQLKRRKHTGRTLTSSASSYIQKRQPI